jgi:5'-3' exonuclease
MKNILLIDSNNLLHRVYWVHKSYAKNTSVPYLFLNSIRKYYNMFNPDVTYAAWDSKILHGQSNFRKDSEVAYKQTRDRDQDEDIYRHESTIKDLCNSLGIHNICPGVLEADDVIYWLSKHFKNDRKTVVSVDKDLVQLVDENTNVFSPIKNELITPENFEELNEIPMAHFVSLKALVGDKSDNIEGVPRVGVKTAQKILLEGNIKDHLNDNDYKIYQRNLDLVDLSRAFNFHPDEEGIYNDQLESFREDSSNVNKFKELCKKFNLKSIMDNMQDWRSIFFKDEFINRLKSFLAESSK